MVFFNSIIPGIIDTPHDPVKQTRVRIVKANLYNLFRERFPKSLTSTFIETPTGRYHSYDDLERESARYARFLTELGLQPGDRVAGQVEKSAAALFLYLGCLRAGLIYLPL